MDISLFFGIDEKRSCRPNNNSSVFPASGYHLAVLRNPKGCHCMALVGRDFAHKLHPVDVPKTEVTASPTNHHSSTVKGQAIQLFTKVCKKIIIITRA